MQSYLDQELGNYRLLRLLGHGGFADVYLGEHIHLGTQAAIKVHHARAKGANQQRFEEEARTIAHLSHPHIVRVLDYGVQDGTPFLVMDYAPHGTLRDLHPAGTMVPLETVVHYVKQIASALQYAHDQKLIHRDVKPENMLLDARYQVLLSDFGIAITAHTTHSLNTQDAIGTVSYMAPEHLKKKARPASDQYTLAVIAYEWLCGSPPFDGLPIQIALQHITDPIPPLRDKLPDLPSAVEHVLLRALAKEPEQRFPNVQAFADALEQATQGDTRAIQPFDHTTRPITVEAVDEKPGRELPQPPRLPERHRSSPGKGMWITPAKGIPLVALVVLLVLAVGLTRVMVTPRHPLPSTVTSSLTISTANATTPLAPIGTPELTPFAPISTPEPTGIVTLPLPPFTSNKNRPGDWTEPNFDVQNTNNNIYEKTLNPQNVARLHQIQHGNGLNGPHYGSSFIVANGKAYWLGNGGPVAIDTQTGQSLWPPKPGIPGCSTPTLANGRIYLGGGGLVTLDATGTLIGHLPFSENMGGFCPSPIVVNDVIYGTAVANEVYAVDEKTDNIIWQTPLPDVTSTPAFANGILYVSGYRSIYAIAAATGTLLWQTQSIGKGNTLLQPGAGYDAGFFAPVIGSNHDFLAFLFLHFADHLLSAILSLAHLQRKREYSSTQETIPTGNWRQAG